jgi:RluA family pseudouridine synthase
LLFFPLELSETKVECRIAAKRRYPPPQQPISWNLRSSKALSDHMHPILNIAAYKFVRLSDLTARRTRLLELCKQWNLKGSILLSPEGINLFVAGEAREAEWLLEELRSWPELHDLKTKINGTERLPFRRMIVRIKQEIIAFGVEGIDPVEHTSPRIAPRELKQWLDEGRAVTLLDTRNNYEVRVGTFKGALPIGIEHFREFPAAVSKLSSEAKEQPLVIFCTGGIRCEKAGPLLEREGFKQVLQLDGGILSYFEQCGGEHFEGECFVFDQRTGLDPALRPTNWTQCFACRTPLSADDQQHAHYLAGKSCPYCYETPADSMAIVLTKRHEAVNRIITPLPGGEPRDHLRPISIPAVCEGMRLVDALCHVVAHVSRQTWEERCARSHLLDADHRRAAATTIVRTGERYFLRFPAVVEPDVNMRIQILHEDESIVVLNKPAPLPMHAGGRFHRNTLRYVLDEVYRPQKLRPSHRLDANTTGVLVVARTQFVAGKIQPQFARGEVDKRYLVRVQGHPASDAFICDAPISTDASKAGSRIVDPVAGLASRTEFRVIERSTDATTLLEARPLTGRTNQIRVHLWHLGFPVCGDQSYLAGDVLGDHQTLSVNEPPLCLHAWRLTFRHPVTTHAVTFTAPPPAWTYRTRRVDTRVAQHC